MSWQDDPEIEKAMVKQYNAVLESPVTERGTDWLAKAHLLLRIADADTAKWVAHEPAGTAAATREYEQLTDDERRDLIEDVCAYWSVCVKSAIKKLWHVCAVLEINPTSLQIDHIGITAASLIGGDGPFEPNQVDAGA